MSEGPLWDVIDCFSGGGLFSLGAQAAGMQIRECVDNSPDALSVYKLNFPVNVSCATLGPGLSEYAFPKPRPQLHVHLSPPCTELSNAKSGKRLEAEGIAMLRWSVEIGAQYHSFSVETVYTAHTLALAKEMVVEQPEVIKFGVYDAINFSAPQSRVRLIISTPQIIKRLNEAPASARVSVEDAFNAERVELPPGATHLKNSSPVVDGSNVRPIQGPAFTCCASRALSFCDSAGRTVVSMKPSHTRVLMGLPSFKLSGNVGSSESTNVCSAMESFLVFLVPLLSPRWGGQSSRRRHGTHRCQNQLEELAPAENWRSGSCEWSVASPS